MQKFLDPRYVYSVWNTVERAFMMVSPILLLAGSAATMMNVPILPDIALMVAYADLDVLLYRSAMNVIRDPHSSYILLLIPMLVWVIVCVVMTAAQLTFPIDELWFRLFLLGIALAFTSILYQQYRTRRVFMVD